MTCRRNVPAAPKNIYIQGVDPCPKVNVSWQRADTLYILIDWGRCHSGCMVTTRDFDKKIWNDLLNTITTLLVFTIKIYSNCKPAGDQSRYILLKFITTRRHTQHNCCLLKDESCSELFRRLSGAHDVLLYDLSPLLLFSYMLSHVSVDLGLEVVWCEVRRTVVSDDALEEIDRRDIYLQTQW